MSVQKSLFPGVKEEEYLESIKRKFEEEDPTYRITENILPIMPRFHECLKEEYNISYFSRYRRDKKETVFSLTTDGNYTNKVLRVKWDGNSMEVTDEHEIEEPSDSLDYWSRDYEPLIEHELNKLSNLDGENYKEIHSEPLMVEDCRILNEEGRLIGFCEFHYGEDFPHLWKRDHDENLLKREFEGMEEELRLLRVIFRGNVRDRKVRLDVMYDSVKSDPEEIDTSNGEVWARLDSNLEIPFP